jgi:peptide/nickel transport system substrate-binding protein
MDQYRRGDIPESLPYAPTQAKKLLDEAGWNDTDRDGVREKDGQDFRFTAIVTPGLELDRQSPIYVQEQLRRVDVIMEIQPLAFSVLRSRIKSGDFEAAFYPFGAVRLSNWGDRGGSPFGYDNPIVLDRLKKAEDDRMPGWADRLYRDLSPIFLKDVPLTLLYPSFRSTVAHRSIRGLSSPFRIDPVRFAEYLWIEDDK